MQWTKKMLIYFQIVVVSLANQVSVLHHVVQEQQREWQRRQIYWHLCLLFALFSKTGKSRRKAERKKHSLREGSEHEDIALLEALRDIVVNANNTQGEIFNESIHLQSWSSGVETASHGPSTSGVETASCDPSTSGVETASHGPSTSSVETAGCDPSTGNSQSWRNCLVNL